MPWAFAIIFLVSSHGYAFYQGYQWASKDYVIRQQTAKLRHINITGAYLRNAVNIAKDETNKVAADLEISATKLNKLEADIASGKLGTACSDQFFERIR